MNPKAHLREHSCINTWDKEDSGSTTTFDQYACEEEVRPTLDNEFESAKLSDNPTRLEKMGFGLSPTIRSMLIECLMVNTYLFVISPYEMPDIDPSVACHQLNVDVSVCYVSRW